MGNAMKREEAVCALLMSDDPTDIDEITIVDDAGNPIDNEAKMEYVRKSEGIISQGLEGVG